MWQDEILKKKVEYRTVGDSDGGDIRISTSKMTQVDAIAITEAMAGWHMASVEELAILGLDNYEVRKLVLRHFGLGGVITGEKGLSHDGPCDANDRGKRRPLYSGLWNNLSKEKQNAIMEVFWSLNKARRIYEVSGSYPVIVYCQSADQLHCLTAVADGSAGDCGWVVWVEDDNAELPLDTAPLKYAYYTAGAERISKSVLSCGESIEATKMMVGWHIANTEELTVLKETNEEVKKLLIISIVITGDKGPSTHGPCEIMGKGKRRPLSEKWGTLSEVEEIVVINEFLKLPESKRAWEYHKEYSGSGFLSVHYDNSISGHMQVMDEYSQGRVVWVRDSS